MKRTVSEIVHARFNPQAFNATDGIPAHEEIDELNCDNINVEELTIFKSYSEGSAPMKSSFKLPESVRRVILKKANEKREPESGMIELKKTESSLQKPLTFICRICEFEHEEKEKVKMASCDHIFCDSCLQHYAIYKIGKFEEVLCPEEECDEVINIETPFFQNLPEDIRKRYPKLHTFYVASKNPKLRLCPNEKCEDGILNLDEKTSPTCNKCKRVFCSKCFFEAHRGQCERNEVNFFKKNLHYRQCSKCKSIIEKNQGCNHMTCRCGYQFCYRCGKKWRSSSHLCSQDGCCAKLFRNLNDEVCCEFIIKILVKILLCLPIWILMILLFLIRLIAFQSLLLIAAILTGIFPNACKLICTQNSHWLKLLLVLAYPIVILYGIIIGISDLSTNFSKQFTNFVENCQQFANCLLCW